MGDDEEGASDEGSPLTFYSPCLLLIQLNPVGFALTERLPAIFSARESGRHRGFCAWVWRRNIEEGKD